MYKLIVQTNNGCTKSYKPRKKPRNEQAKLYKLMNKPTREYTLRSCSQNLDSKLELLMSV